jgi:anti-sigma B factor antagonist
MMLQIVATETDGVTVLDLSGRLVFGEETDALRECMGRLVAQNKTKVLMNFEDLTFVDSSGIGTLMAALSQMKQCGGVVKLATAVAQVDKVLRLTGVLNVLELYSTKQEAMASF